MNGTQPAKRPTGLYFLGGVLALYAVLLIMSGDKAREALASSAVILGKLLPILIVVVLLLGLFAHYFKPGKFAKHLGGEAGWRAWAYALAGGILSHGPSYVWYPLLQELRSHGTRDGLVVTFLYVRAIKLPWLPVMVDYFGWSFTLLLSLFLILFGLLQGWLVERIAHQIRTET